MNDIERRTTTTSDQPRRNGGVRLVVLTAGYGEGHNAAARALAAAWGEIHGPGTARVADVLAEAAPRFNAFVRRAYIEAINRAPRLWGRAYRWMDRSPLLLRVLRRQRTGLPEIERLLAEERPAAVCCTYPAYGFLLDQLSRAGRLATPYFMVVTDSISINSLWWRSACESWFVSDEDSAEVMREAGVPPERIRVCGFPVALFFGKNDGVLSPPDLASGAAPRVLHIVNSGTRNAEAVARLLLAETDWEVTCAVGRDSGMKRRLEPLAANRRRPASIMGWTDQIPRLLMTHHVVVSKAGGATTQEAIAARCPMVVSQVVPGQEEGNCELLRRHGAGVLAETPEEILRRLHAAFESGGAGWRAWRAAFSQISRPDAAFAVAREVATLCAR